MARKGIIETNARTSRGKVQLAKGQFFDSYFPVEGQVGTIFPQRNWEFSNTREENVLPIVKGRLRENIGYWESINANETILSIIREGYRIPFVQTPPGRKSKNNKSALKYPEFVKKSILELLETGRIKECRKPPKVVNPLSVSVQGKDQHGKEKLRLILDLREVNKHVFKDKIKFDDWKLMEQYLVQDGFAFSFDITQGYHHIDIHPDFHEYLGFYWFFEGKVRYFIFVVLPFGLTSAPFIFTKIVRCLVKWWRGQGIKICVYIDDGLGVEKYCALATKHSKIVEESLEKSGFLANKVKSVWDPTQTISWLGITVDLKEGIMCITEKRVKVLYETINSIIDALPYVSARQLSRLTGRVISTKIILGNITQLKTRHLYRFIDSCWAWDQKFTVLHWQYLLDEIVFWRTNFNKLNIRRLNDYSVPTLIISSDASSSGLAALFQVGEREFISYKNLSGSEAPQSSTFRELLAILYGLVSFKHFFQNRYILWHTDNWAATSIVTKGSNKEALQQMAESIFHLCAKHSIKLLVRWVSRDMIPYTDRISKTLDHDDWCSTVELFNLVDEKWGPHTVDRFADSSNTKLPRFNSKFHCPNTEQVDALAIGWGSENNYLVPPVSLIPKVLQHMNSFAGFGTLITPYWPSAPFFPLLKQDKKKFHVFVKDLIFIPETKNLIKQGNNRKVHIGSEHFKSGILVLRIDFQK